MVIFNSYGDFQLLLLLLLLLSLYMYIYDHRIILIHPCDISLSRLVLHGLRLRQQLVQASFVQGRGTAGPPQGPGGDGGEHRPGRGAESGRETPGICGKEWSFHSCFHGKHTKSY